jgi:hypothetical protein
MFLHFEIRYAVTQQASGLRLALEDMDLVADAGQLLRSGKAGRA